MLPTYSYALPTKSTEVMLMQEQGTKTYVDAVLKTHHRVIQLSTLNAALCPHTEADFQARFKARPELEGLIAQMNQ
ncbi:39S ribosomal protein L48, mitochondrial-like [Oreochromis niloticus]|uniref:39S ribosomal protein L48, mitochondrial-like n=1 Tax=Oreochromis niloticus TaxID=8128 RepID=UPI000904CF84|nr:39S ribosomal protein L48, mitochondrial-like [Oreochromis niloticus]